MILTTLILMNLLWISYSLTEGIREGFYWHYENKCKRNCDFDINPIFNSQRVGFLFVLTTLMFTVVKWYSILFMVGMVLEFSFFHNGTYYYTRNKLGGKVYPKGWQDESKTFPPFTPLMKYKRRTTAMLVGFLLQIFIYLFFIN